MGIIIVCLLVSGLFFLLSKDAIGATTALGAAVIAPIVAFVVYVCFGAESTAGIGMAVLAYAGVLGYYYYRGSKEEARSAEAVAPYVQSCMDLIEDLSHFMTDTDRRAYFHYDPEKKCVMAELRIRDGYVGTYWVAQGISSEEAESLIKERGFGDYQPKHWACVCAVEDGTVENDDLHYAVSLGYQNNAHVMVYLLDAAQARFPGEIEHAKSYNMGEDATFWVHFPAQ